MEFLEKFFRIQRVHASRKEGGREEILGPDNEMLCQEIINIVQIKAHEGHVFKNHYPIKNVIIDKSDFPGLWMDNPHLTAHMISHRRLAFLPDSTSVRMHRFSDKVWWVETEKWGKDRWDKDSFDWQRVYGKEAGKLLTELLKCVKDARPNKYW